MPESSRSPLKESPRRPFTHFLKKAPPYSPPPPRGATRDTRDTIESIESHIVEDLERHMQNNNAVITPPPPPEPHATREMEGESNSLEPPSIGDGDFETIEVTP